MPVVEWLLALEKLEGHYDYLAQLAQGYEKNPGKLEENLHHVYGWRDSHMLKALMKREIAR